jgi:hypothetical protein
MARPVVGNPFEGQIGTVAPTARPVDIYERGVVKQSPFEALSRTLSNLEQRAVPALQREEARRAENEFQEGQRLYQENRIAIGEAVKNGLIDEGESPYLRKGYRISQMNTMGMRYTAELESALENQKLYTNGNPERIEQFIETFQSKFIENNGMSTFSAAEVSEHFGTTAAKTEEIFRQTWRKRHVAWQREQNYKAFQREVAEATVALFKPEMTIDERQAAMGTFATWLEDKAASASTDGMDNQNVINTILQGVGIVVQKTGQTDILDVFKSTNFGTGAAASSLAVQSKLLSIEATAIRIENANAAAADRELEDSYEVVRATTRSLLDDFTTTPNPENRANVEDAIATLMATPDDNNTKLGTLIRTQLNAYDQAEITGGRNKTAETEIRIERSLQAAQTFDEMSSLLATAARNGELTPADVTAKINKWRNHFDPANDAQFNLDFFTTSTPEGHAISQLQTLIKGNPEDFSNLSYRRSIDETNRLRQAIREGVKLFEEINGRSPITRERDEISQNAMKIIVDRLVDDEILDDYKKVDKP